MPIRVFNIMTILFSLFLFGSSIFLHNHNVFKILHFEYILYNFLIIYCVVIIGFIATSFLYSKFLHKSFLSYFNVISFLYVSLESLFCVFLAIGSIINIAYLEQINSSQIYDNIISIAIPTFVTMLFFISITYFLFLKKITNYIISFFMIFSIISVSLFLHNQKFFFDILNRDKIQSLETLSVGINNDIFNDKNFLDKTFCFDQSQKYFLEKVNNTDLLYTIHGSEKLVLAIKKDFDLTEIIFDGEALIKQNDDINSSYYIYTTEYDIKPGTFNLTLVQGNNKKNLQITIQYFYSPEYNEKVLDVWRSGRKDFLSLNPEGILLTSTKKDVDFLGFQRRFENNNIMFEMTFKPINKYQIDFSIYFGEKTYIVFNNKYIRIHQTLLDRKTKIMQEKEYEKFKENTFYKLKIVRIDHLYKIYINDEFKLEYFDNNEEAIKEEKYKNIGLSFPKTNTSILINQMIIK